MHTYKVYIEIWCTEHKMENTKKSITILISPLREYLLEPLGLVVEIDSLADPTLLHFLHLLRVPKPAPVLRFPLDVEGWLDTEFSALVALKLNGLQILVVELLVPDDRGILNIQGLVACARYSGRIIGCPVCFYFGTGYCLPEHVLLRCYDLVSRKPSIPCAVLQ